MGYWQYGDIGARKPSPYPHNIKNNRWRLQLFMRSQQDVVSYPLVSSNIDMDDFPSWTARYLHLHGISQLAMFDYPVVICYIAVENHHFTAGKFYF